MAKKDVSISVNVAGNAQKEFNKIAASAEGAISKIDAMKSSILAISAGVGLAGIGASITKTTYDWAASVNNLEDVTGMAGESASKLLVVGQAVGLTGETITSAMVKMSKSVSSAQQSMVNAAATGSESTDIYTRFGIAVQDANGKLIPAEQILKNVLNVHRQLPNGIEKTNMEMEIFGKKGAELNDLLNLTGSDIERLIKKAEDMGLVLNSETSQAWENLRFQVNEAGLSFKGLQVQIGTELMPTVKDIVDSLSGWMTAFQKLDPETKAATVEAVKYAAELGVMSVAIKGIIALSAPFGIALAGPWIGIPAAIGAAIGALGNYKKKQMELAGQTITIKDELGNDVETPNPYWKGYDSSESMLESDAMIAAQRDAEKRNNTNIPPPIASGSNSAADKAARELKQSAERAVELTASLQSRITGLVGTAQQSSADKLKSELTKMDNDIADWGIKGADTSGTIAKRNEYEKTAIAESARIQSEALTDLKNDTALAYAQMTGDKKAQADAEYQIALTSIAKEKEKRWEATGDQKAVLDWKAKKEQEAAEKHAQTLREQSIEDKNRAIDQAQFLVDIEGKPQGEINVIKRAAVEEAIANDKKLLLLTKANSTERYNVERDLVEKKNQLYALDAQNISTSSQEAYRQISQQTSDYAKIQVDAWNDINSHVEGHFVDMLTGAESFSKGIKGIAKDLKTDIITMFAKMAYELYIMNPIKSWFATNILGVSGTTGSSLSYTSPYAGTGYSLAGKASGGPVSAGQMYKVNELGIETFVPSTNGYIMTAGQTRQAMNSTPNVQVNIENNSGQQVQATNQSVTIDQSTGNVFVRLLVDKVSRNDGGSRDDLRSALGVNG